MPGWLERATPVAGRGGGPPTSAADAGTGWRKLESSVGTGSGRGRLLQPDLVTAGTCGCGTGAADGGQARCDEVADWQAERSTRGARAREGRQSGPHACGGREPGTTGGSEKRGIAVALRKAKAELGKLDRLAQAKRISRSSLEQRIKKTLGREHLSRFVVTEIGGDDKKPTLNWYVDAALRRELEKTRLGRW